MDAPRWTDEAKDQIATLLRQGLSASHIAARFRNTSRNSIIGLVHRDNKLRKLGFVNANRGQPKLKPPTKKKKPPVRSRVVTAELPPTPRPLPPASPNIPMLAIGTCQCRWPMWDGNGAPDFLMCGASTTIERIYCTRHAARVFQPPRERR